MTQRDSNAASGVVRDQQAVLAKLKCAAGLAELASGHFKQAAKHLLMTSFDYCDFPEVGISFSGLFSHTYTYT